MIVTYPHYHAAAVTATGDEPPWPDGTRPAFGWPAVALAPGQRVELTWPRPRRATTPYRLRIIVAIDDRHERRIAVRLRDSGDVVGVLDLRMAFQLQPFELVLSAQLTTAAMRHGVFLELLAGDGGPLWLLASGIDDDYWRPHLVASPDHDPSSRRRAFSRWLSSPRSLQAFGWREQCVFDGLWEINWNACWPHARQFHDDDLNLVYEDAHSRIVRDEFHGIETGGMIAALFRWWPQHPILDTGLAFWRSRQDAEGCVIDGATTSAEGSYTVAFPMAVIAAKRRDRTLGEWALQQLRLRRQRLCTGDDVWLRWHAQTQQHTFRNWARGTAWYMLGLARTLERLHDTHDAADLVDELRRVAAIAIDRQQRNGLWLNFTDDVDTTIDTSGSAGIAAALAIGARGRLLPPDMRAAAERALQGLLAYLTPDGLLTGCAQDNRGGEALQREAYHVIHPAGGGLLGQLIAALRVTRPRPGRASFRAAATRSPRRLGRDRDWRRCGAGRSGS